MRPRTSAVAGCLVGALAVAGAALAESALEAAVSVRESRDGCITASALRARVQRWLKPAALRAGIRVMVDAASEPVSFRVERDGVQVAARSFELLPAACGDRLDAVGIAVALAIEHAASPETASATREGGVAAEAGAAGDRGAAATTASTPAAGGAESHAREPSVDAGQPQPSAEAKPKAGAEPEAEAKPAAAAKPSEKPKAKPAQPGPPLRATKHAFRVHAGGMFLLEALPDSGLAASLGAELMVSDHLHVGFTALFAPESKTALASGGAHTRLLAGEALACLGVPAWVLALEGCAGAAGGAGFASGYGLMPPDGHATVGWAAGVLRAAVRAPTSSMFSARVAFDGLANVWRPQLEVQVPGRSAKSTASTGVLGFAASLQLLFELP